MKNNPLKGDWYLLLKEDFNNIGIDIDEEKFAEMSKIDYKSYIKKKVRELTFQKLIQKKMTHKKISNITYKNLYSRQAYLNSPLFNNFLTSLLFNLRSRCLNEFRDNFHSMYGGNIQCQLCLSNINSQEHGLSCPVIITTLKTDEIKLLETVKYENIYGDTHEQYKIASMYKVILRQKKKLLEDRGLAHRGFDTDL